MQLENATKKRERMGSEPGILEPKLEKKRLRASQQPPEQELPKEFTPYDYSKSDFKAFAGKDKISCWEYLKPQPIQGGPGLGSERTLTGPNMLHY